VLLFFPDLDGEKELLVPRLRRTRLGSLAAVEGDDVLAAAELCRSALEPALGADWRTAVPGLDFTVASVVAHAAEAPLWYSVDLWSGQENAAFEVKVLPDATNESLLTSLLAASQALAAVVDAAPPDTRGFHPFGSPDPAGFAAMGCDELLVHGDDAARGLGVPFTPDARLAAAVLARLFPWHTAGPDDDPWELLLWANGRTEVRGRVHQSRWRWHCAPLAEWDGTGP
jgi:Mycothiol maleylpyruvate isomerase N-terminal domain